MDPLPHLSSEPEAPKELVQLHRQIEAARSELKRVQADLFETETSLSNSHAAQLITANEHLVLSILRAQEHANTASQAFDQATRSAEHDELTDLPNRTLMHDRFEQAISGAKRRGTRLALLFVDIDKFKQINDAWGHAVGDDVLKIVARCLESSVRETDSVSRHGGDEFLVLLNGIHEPADAARIADKVATCLGQPKQLAGHELTLQASVGISIYPDDGEDAAAMMACADAAMYRAKRRNLGGHVFHGHPSLDTPEPLPADELVKPLAAPALHEAQAFPWADPQPWHLHLREANEQLVLATLDAQQLQFAAEQARQRQSEFLMVLAHELRNPLGPIRAVATLLQHAGPHDLPRLQAMIERQVVHMARLVSDLLDVSRASLGKLRLELQDVDLRSVIDTALDSCRLDIDARNQRFVARIGDGHLHTWGDPIRLTQVVTNLLDNASKYTPKGGAIDLQIDVDRDGDHLLLSVCDNGIGITAEALPHIFDVFAQDTHAIGFNGVGLGIGLTVVRELIEAHGGSVCAESAGAGLGSRFDIRLAVNHA